MYGASQEEQIARLLHDMSHTVFSHCIDYALASGSETQHSFQDDAFLEFIYKSDIPNILRNHELDAEYIFDSTHFPLQERELPDLCADRIDYILRTGIHAREITPSDAKSFLSTLKIHGKDWIFEDAMAAYHFVAYFSKINTIYYSGFRSAIMFRTVGDVIRHLLDKEFITMDMLFTTDRQLLDVICSQLAGRPAQ